LSANVIDKMCDYTYDDDGIPVLKQSAAICENPFADEEDITNIFDICGDGFDVTLSLAEGTLSWTSVNPTRAGGNFNLIIFNDS